MQIFTFDDPLVKAAARIDIADPQADWRAAVRGENPSAHLRGQQYIGRQFREIIWTSLSGVPLISERVANLLKHAGVSGWKTYPLEIVDRDKRPVAGYFGLGIVGRYHGRVGFDTRESALVYQTSQNGRSFPYFKGLRFEASLRDGSDLFVDTYGSGWIFTTERVATVFTEQKITNGCFRRIEDAELLAQESAIQRGI